MQSEGIRFLTLVGLPGVGKTEVARQIKLLVQTLENFEEVFQISFEVKTNVADILQEIDEYLRGRDQQNQTLIILDNCELIEHIDEARISFYKYLEKHSQLTILATSRVSLSDGEYEVKPLGLPHSKSESVENLQNYGAIKLFLAYANADTPILELTEKNKETITTICKKLDALPLALLLAASLVGNLGLAELYKILQHDDIQISEYSLTDYDQHMMLDQDLNVILDDLLTEAIDLKKQTRHEIWARVNRTDFSKIKIDVPKKRIKDFIFYKEPEQMVLDILQHDDIQMIEYSRADYDRHRTLEKLLKASYNLLQEEEKDLFRRLGIFFAPCSIKVATTVCDLGNIPHTINLLSALRRNHLITFQNEQVGISHNIIRSFARRQLDIKLWETLKKTYSNYYSEMLKKYAYQKDRDNITRSWARMVFLNLKIEEGMGMLVEDSSYIIDDLNNIKGMNWLNRTEAKLFEQQETLRLAILEQRFRHPIWFIKIFPFDFLLLLVWNFLKSISSKRVKFK